MVEKKPNLLKHYKELTIFQSWEQVKSRKIQPLENGERKPSHLASVLKRVWKLQHAEPTLCSYLLRLVPTSILLPYEAISSIPAILSVNLQCLQNTMNETIHYVIDHRLIFSLLEFLYRTLLDKYQAYKSKT